MGYSIFIVESDSSKRKLMLKNMTEIYNNFPKFQEGSRLCQGDDISYYGDEYPLNNIIGFDYASWIAEDCRIFIHALLYYVAYKYHKEFIVYDGCEEFKTKKPSEYIDLFLKHHKLLRINKHIKELRQYFISLEKLIKYTLR